MNIRTDDCHQNSQDLPSGAATTRIDACLRSPQKSVPAKTSKTPKNTTGGGGGPCRVNGGPKKVGGWVGGKK